MPRTQGCWRTLQTRHRTRSQSTPGRNTKQRHTQPEHQVTENRYRMLSFTCVGLARAIISSPRTGRLVHDDNIPTYIAKATFAQLSALYRSAVHHKAEYSQQFQAHCGGVGDVAQQQVWWCLLSAFFRTATANLLSPNNFCPACLAYAVRLYRRKCAGSESRVRTSMRERLMLKVD